MAKERCCKLVKQWENWKEKKRLVEKEQRPIYDYDIVIKEKIKGFFCFFKKKVKKQKWFISMGRRSDKTKPTVPTIQRERKLCAEK